MSLTGEWDAYLAPQLKEQLDEAIAGPQPRLVVDLTNCQFFDSTILGLMIGAAKRASEARGGQAIACDRPILLRIFDNSGTREMLNVVPTVDEALATVRGAANAGKGGAGDDCASASR